MAHVTVAPSIESLLKLPPEDSESWVLGSNPKVNRIARHVERAALEMLAAFPLEGDPARSLADELNDRASASRACRAREAGKTDLNRSTECAEPLVGVPQ